jgi:hypothetical protein
MQERNLYQARTRCEFRIVKWLGTVPEIAMCPFCNREFRTRFTRIRQSINALENLQIQFYGHKCQPKRLVIEDLQSKASNSKSVNSTICGGRNE